MTNYNPGNPDTAGMQWPASRTQNIALQAEPGHAAIFDATVTESVDRFKAFIRTPLGQINNPYLARYNLDVYDNATMNPGPIKTAFSVPAADSTSSTWARSDNGTNTNRFQMVDEGPQVFNGSAGLATADNLRAFYPTNDARGPRSATIRFKGNTNWITTDEQFPIGTVVSLTGKRIIDVRVCAWMADLGQQGSFTPTVQGLAFNGSVEVVLPESSSGAPFVLPGSQLTGVCFSMRGSTMGWRNYDPLILADAVTMLTSGAGSFGLSIDGLGNFQLYECHLEVDYCEERRVSTSHADVVYSPELDGQWVTFSTLVPTTNGATTWSKFAGHRYAIVIRANPLTRAGSTWRMLDTGNTVGHEGEFLTGHAGADVPFVGTGTVGYAALPAANSFADLDLMPHAHAFYMTLGATVRSDGQPYAAVQQVEVWASGSTVDQEFNNAGALAYGMVSVLVFNNNAAHATSNPLLVSLRRRSDSAVLGSGSITLADLPALPDDRWYVVKARLDAAPILVPGTQYYVHVESAEPVSSWTVEYANAYTVEAGANTFGGTGQAMTMTAVETTYYDGIMSAVTVPAVPGGRVSNVVAYDTDRGMTGRCGAGCIVGTISYASLTWGGTGLGATFDKYELERNDNGTWVQIARLDASFPSVFADFESLRNVSTSWRVRQFRTDGAFSDWGTFPAQTIPANENEVVLASNDMPTNVLGLLEPAPLRESWQRLSAGRTVERALYGRDKILVFREAEERGERQTRFFIFAIRDDSIEQVPSRGGRAVYDPLVALVENAALPHIALLDHRGRRWYTAPSLTDLGEEEPGGRYVAEIAFVEVAGPTPAITSWTP